MRISAFCLGPVFPAIEGFVSPPLSAVVWEDSQVIFVVMFAYGLVVSCGDLFVGIHRGIYLYSVGETPCEYFVSHMAYVYCLV